MKNDICITDKGKKITLEDAVREVEYAGDGYTKIEDGCYAFSEGWKDSCVEDVCAEFIGNIEKYSECAWNYATDYTYNKLPSEIEDDGFQIVKIEHINRGWNPYGTSVALLKK